MMTTRVGASPIAIAWKKSRPGKIYSPLIYHEYMTYYEWGPIAIAWNKSHPGTATHIHPQP